jgi:hypothetical protein
MRLFFKKGQKILLTEGYSICPSALTICLQINQKLTFSHPTKKDTWMQIQEVDPKVNGMGKKGYSIKCEPVKVP